ncbi:olfactory receptor 6B3-like [Hyperolius riggenbachi]|uniref:olfactory receptor 6B3-like n=1 Tax=Hyperolius riggenbachi TaxID=752182 RepID=UPI0035A2D9E4
MSYDRYVAICSPLRYYMIMSSRVRASIATVCWLTGFVQAFPMLVLFSRHSCFSSREINHFFCDIMELLHLACHDVSTLELLNFVNALLLAVFPFFLTFSSYIFIVIAILKISSSTGRFKTFYTCSSHLTVIILIYTSLVCQYLIPVTGNTGKDFNKQFSLFNTALVPMLNPLIYSLKNKDVKNAFWSRCGISL